MASEILEKIREARVELEKIDIDHYKILGQLYGMKIICNEYLPENEWYLVVGKNVYKQIQESIKEKDAM